MKIALIQQSAGCDREENIECALEAMSGWGITGSDSDDAHY